MVRYLGPGGLIWVIPVKIAYEEPTQARERARTLSERLAAITGVGVLAPIGQMELASLEQACESVGGLIDELGGVYSMPTDKLKLLAAGKSIEEAQGVLQTERQARSKELGDLVSEWNLLADTLRSLGEDVGQRPVSLDALKDAVSELESNCRELIGDPGRMLLDFVVGKSDFPRKLTFKQTKEALGQLRPFILRGIGGASWPK